MKKQKNENAAVNSVAAHQEPLHHDPRFSSAMETFVKKFEPDSVEQIKNDLDSASSIFTDLSDRDLTLSQRRRKVGAGIRNYGFIVKTAELAAEHPQFASLFNLEVLQNCISNFEDSRSINIILQAMVRQTSNSMLVYSDEAYSLALIFYNSVKEIARRGVPEAITLFRQLEPFFRRRNPEKGSKPPTESEVERDVKALLRGKKDGEIIIKKEKPHLVGGEHEVIDEVHKGKVAVKEIREAEEKE